MRHLTVAFVTLLFAAASIIDAADNHVKLLGETTYPLQYASLDPRTGEMDEIRTHCTAFSVNPEHRGWMTAAHCVLGDEPYPLVATEFFIAGHPAEIVKINVEHDLVLMRTLDWGIAKGLKLAKRAPKVGDTVEALGYAWGLAQPFYSRGTVAQIESDIGGFIGTLAGMQVVSGMSGGPVIDSTGRVVGVIHVLIGDTPRIGATIGFTSYSVLKAYDWGWVFSS